ncbi:hypothetical protein BKA63DRAFT_567023 [Paraphoma chrysanthemicola]|nr:hypothetical protein BKA63DRAFT_567023 [Paraphoma chrysanthemicola]
MLAYRLQLENNYLKHKTCSSAVWFGCRICPHSPVPSVYRSWFKNKVRAAKSEKPGGGTKKAGDGQEKEDGLTEQERRHAARGPSPESPDFSDLRRYPDIIKDGLDGRYARIEDIKPLAQTVMHELIHAVGGLANPNKGVLKIGDGSNKDTYGWLACNKRRINRDSIIDIADCITFLGQAIYLSQI